ncbi:MAG TPA: LON peptidase substrate-binding domain-containing protein [Polyangia bacterium]|nr:LON peptidase substrate-binding domain-containing protein [Polyangia bacterium]
MAEPAAAPDPSLAETLRRLPLFPLPNAVLFPHALLSLHIFEERYRAMTRDILAGARCMAVGLIAPGASEEDERPAVLPIAGVGEVVMAHELPDGRFNLVLRGRARVRIDEELASDRPYRLVSATELPDVPVANPSEIADADQTLRALIGRLSETLAEGGDLLRQMMAAQESPAELVDGVASALIADPALRQRLLEMRDVGQRLERVSAEVVAMTARLATPGTTN